MPIVEEKKRKKPYKARPKKMNDDKWCTIQASRYAALRVKLAFVTFEEEAKMIEDELHDIEASYIERFNKNNRGKELIKLLNKPVKL